MHLQPRWAGGSVWVQDMTALRGGQKAPLRWETRVWGVEACPAVTGRLRVCSGRANPWKAPTGLCAPRVSAPAERWGLVQLPPSRTCSGPLGRPCAVSCLIPPLSPCTLAAPPVSSPPGPLWSPASLWALPLQCRVRDWLPPGGPPWLGSSGWQVPPSTTRGSLTGWVSWGLIT